MKKRMSFADAVKYLNIEDFADRIFLSNSHGELMHLGDYIDFAAHIKDPSWFRLLFITCVEFAEKTWQHPEHCFQHMPRLMADAAAAIHRINRKS